MLLCWQFDNVGSLLRRNIHDAMNYIYKFQSIQWLANDVVGYKYGTRFICWSHSQLIMHDLRFIFLEKLNYNYSLIKLNYNYSLIRVKTRRPKAAAPKKLNYS